MLICLRTTSQGSIISTFLNQLSIHPFAQRFVTLLCVFIYTCFWQASHLLVSVYILQPSQPTGRAVFLLVNHLFPLHPFGCSCLWNQHMKYQIFGVCPHLMSIYSTKLTVMRSFEMHISTPVKRPTTEGKVSRQIACVCINNCCWTWWTFYPSYAVASAFRLLNHIPHSRWYCWGLCKLGACSTFAKTSVKASSPQLWKVCLPNKRRAIAAF